MHKLAYLALLCGHHSMAYALPEADGLGTATLPIKGVRTDLPSTDSCTFTFVKDTYQGKPVWVQHDSDGTLDMCETYCKPYQDPDASVNSATCLKTDDVFWDISGNLKSDDMPDGTVVHGVGSCLCNNPLLDKIVEDIVTKILPAIGEIACKTWFTAIDTVIQVGLSAIPGLGAVEATLVNFAAQAAETIAYAISDAAKAKERYQQFLQDPDNKDAAQAAGTSLMDNVCGNKYTPPDAEAIFNAFQITSSFASAPKLFAGAAKSWPPPFAKGKGTPEEIDNYINSLNPRSKGKPQKTQQSDPTDTEKTGQEPTGTKPRKTQGRGQSTDTDEAQRTGTERTGKQEPTGKPQKTEGTGTTTKPETTKPPSRCTAKNGKRGDTDPKGGDKGCDGDITLYSIENLRPGKTNKPRITCDRKFPQACAHYQSAIHAGKSGEFKCTASHNINGRGNEAPAVASWKNQHKDPTWKSYTDTSPKYGNEANQKLSCEVDEWPPNYFASDEDLKAGTKGQIVRWIPSYDNGGAGQLWKGFCKKHDGNEGNGLRENPPPNKVQKADDKVDIKTRSFNKDLVDLLGKDPKTVQNPNQRPDGGVVTTTLIWESAVYSQGVFSFQWDFEKEPSENDWLLAENPCWPEDIAPVDMGYPLVTDDPWYEDHLDAKKFMEANAYSMPPAAGILKAANQKQKAPKRPHDSDDDDNDNNGKNNNKNNNDNGSDGEENNGSGSRRRRNANEVLEIVDGKLMARDEELNITRPLTQLELRDEVEVRRCSDRTCTGERRELAKKLLGNRAVMVPGHAPPSMPSENGAEPTFATGFVTQVRAVLERTPLSADLPGETGSPAES